MKRQTFRNEDGKVVAYRGATGFHYAHPRTGREITITKVCQDRLLVKMDKVSDRTPSGLLFIPDQAKRKPQVGTVVMHGDYTREYWMEKPQHRLTREEKRAINRHYPVEFEEGDRILFRPVSGMPLYWDMSVEIWFFRSAEILAIVDEDKQPFTPYDTNIHDDEEEEDFDDEPALEAGP